MQSRPLLLQVRPPRRGSPSYGVLIIILLAVVSEAGNEGDGRLPRAAMRRHEVELAAALLLSGLPLGQRSTLSAICILLSR